VVRFYCARNVYMRAMQAKGSGALDNSEGRAVDLCVCCNIPTYLSIDERLYAAVFTYPQLTHQALHLLRMGYGLKGRAFDSRQRQAIFLYSTVSRPALGPIRLFPQK
jgi:hypothetical protein